MKTVQRGFMFARKIQKINGENLIFEGIAYPNAQIPEYQTKNSAGADFFCAETVVIPSIWKLLMKAMSACIETFSVDSIKGILKPTLVHTGIKACMGEDEVLRLYNRSSNPGKMGLILANGVGVVDADYFENEDNDGEIMFAFYNVMPWDVTVEVESRIGQGIFEKFLRPNVGLRVKNIEREGGFGSTSK